jgi:hypothetical protein
MSKDQTQVNGTLLTKNCLANMLLKVVNYAYDTLYVSVCDILTATLL